jgi:hypothetical protein
VRKYLRWVSYGVMALGVGYGLASVIAQESGYGSKYYSELRGLGFAGFLIGIVLYYFSQSSK